MMHKKDNHRGTNSKWTDHTLSGSVEFSHGLGLDCFLWVDPCVVVHSVTCRAS